MGSNRVGVNAIDIREKGLEARVFFISFKIGDWNWGSSVERDGYTRDSAAPTIHYPITGFSDFEIRNLEVTLEKNSAFAN